VDAILEAAAGLIATGGYAATTTNKIAERAGVSIGSLYQYFPNKGAVLVSLLERHLARVAPAIDRSLTELSDPHIPYIEGTRRLLTRLLALHDEDPRLLKALTEEVPHPPHVHKLHQQKDAAYTARLADILRRRRDVEVGNPDAAAQVLVQAAGALSRWLAHEKTTAPDRDECIDEAVRLLTGHVRPYSTTRRKGAS
jgi:AcrR family transcriptional regulator